MAGRSGKAETGRTLYVTKDGILIEEMPSIVDRYEGGERIEINDRVYEVTDSQMNPGPEPVLRVELVEVYDE